MERYNVGELAQDVTGNLIAASLLWLFPLSQFSGPIAFGVAFLVVVLSILRPTTLQRGGLTGALGHLGVALALSALPVLAVNFVLSGLFLTTHGFALPFPLSVLRVVVSFVIAVIFVQLVEWAWERFALRSRILSLAQSRLTLWVGTLIVAGVIILLLRPLLVIYVLPLVPPVWNRPLADVGLIVVAILVCAGVIYRVMRRLLKPKIRATQCEYVLKRIWREGIVGELEYTFLEGTSTRQVMAQFRILDYLAARPSGAASGSLAQQLLVRRRWGTYRVQVVDPPAWLSQADEPGQSDRETRQREETRYAEWTVEFAKLANDVCTDGHTQGWWERIGPDIPFPTEKLYASAFFGNKLDALFNGGDGYRVGSPGLYRFTTLVVKGQPGAGKSTFALQLCVTLARQGHLCLYYSLEEEREILLQSARDFGWLQAQATPTPEVQHALAAGRHLKGDLKAQATPTPEVQLHTSASDNGTSVSAIPAEDSHVSLPAHYLGIRFKTDSGLAETLTRRVSDLGPHDGAVVVSSLGNRTMRVQERMQALRREWVVPLDRLLRCVVIDSLEGFANASLEGDGRSTVLRDQFIELKNFFRDRCDILLIVAEEDGSDRRKYVDYVADTVIQLGRRDEDGYVILSAEVEKARNQAHALGQHQMKIRASTDLGTIESRSEGSSLASRTSRSPWDNPPSPGVLIYPSVDYLLSQLRSRPTFDPGQLGSGFSGLDTLLGGDRAVGLRRQSATALLGPGSTGKSIIALNFLLEGVRENKRTLLLSLRDDEGIIKRRPIPQEPGRIRLQWDEVKDLHRLEWEVTGIAAWLNQLRARVQLHAITNPGEPPPEAQAELPYLFHDGSRTPALSQALSQALFRIPG